MSDNIQGLFKSFVQDIIKVFPEYDKRLNKYYSSIIDSSNGEGDEKDKLLNDFFENIEEITDDICNENLEIFKTDPIILQNVSFKVIWESNITNDTKINIWKYLQSFCIYNFNKSEEDIDVIIKNLQQNEKVKDKEALNKAKKLKKLSESIKSDSIKNKIEGKLEDIEDLENDPSMKQMEDLLENTSIGKIAKEVTEELDIENMIGEGGGIEDIMRGDNMMNIFKSISSKIDSANTGGGNIMEEAIGISKNMQGNPLFSSMFSGLSKMDTASQSAVSQATENSNNRTIRLSNPHDGNETKRRLQKKLKEKEDKLEVNKKQ